MATLISTSFSSITRNLYTPFLRRDFEILDNYDNVLVSPHEFDIYIYPVSAIFLTMGNEKHHRLFLGLSKYHGHNYHHQEKLSPPRV